MLSSVLYITRWPLHLDSHYDASTSHPVRADAAMT